MRRALQAEAKVWRRISRVLLDAPSDPFLKSLFHHSAGVSHYTVCAALLETVAAHRAIREGFAKDLGQDFWDVIQCLFEMRLGPLGAPPHPKVRTYFIILQTILGCITVQVPPWQCVGFCSDSSKACPLCAGDVRRWLCCLQLAGVIIVILERWRCALQGRDLLNVPCCAPGLAG